MGTLRLVADVAGTDFWVGAGFLRAAVWDFLHGRAPSPPEGDVDVVWFDAGACDAALDRAIEARLFASDPGEKWSVKNQARMHARNGDTPYVSLADAIAHWPETATAIAARVVDGRIEVLAPHGTEDLFSLTLRPTPTFAGEKYAVFAERVRSKRWLERWPRLRIAT